MATQDQQTMINWTRPMLERFKVMYRKVKETNAETFTFDGNVYVVNYAKYLIEYLEQRL